MNVHQAKFKIYNLKHLTDHTYTHTYSITDGVRVLEKCLVVSEKIHSTKLLVPFYLSFQRQILQQVHLYILGLTYEFDLGHISCFSEYK